MNHCHERVRDVLGFPREFVLHSLRHTFGTRLGENGTDVFAIQRLMGHSSIIVSQRFVHPTPEIMENAILAQERASQEFADRPVLPTNSTQSNRPCEGCYSKYLHFQRARVAKLADARDLKSRAPKGA